MATRGLETVHIDAAPEAVWPWVADLERHSDWSPKPYRAELVDGAAGAVGSRYRSVGEIPNDKHHENEVELLEVVPNERLVLRAVDPQGQYLSTYRLSPRADGTEVEFELVFEQVHGVAKLLLPIIFPLVGKKDLAARMVLLKQKVEAGAP